jgi:hypothetical protein
LFFTFVCFLLVLSLRREKMAPKIQHQTSVTPDVFVNEVAVPTALSTVAVTTATLPTPEPDRPVAVHTATVLTDTSTIIPAESLTEAQLTVNGLAVEASQHMPLTQGRVLSRTDEMSVITALDLRVGARCLLQWRTSETLDEVAGEWFTTEVQITGTEVCPTTGRPVYLTSFLWEGEEMQGRLPLIAAFEMRDIKRIKGPAKSMSEFLTKRPRELEKTTTQEPMHGFELASVIAHASMDVKRGKSSIEVKGADGLRVPSTISLLWTAVYPHIWFRKRETAGEDAEVLEESWRQALANLQTFLGVSIKNPAKRDEALRASDNVVNLIYRRTPISKLEWSSIFENCFILLHGWFSILHGKHNADLLLSKVRTSFGQGFLDIEEIVRTIEATVSGNGGPTEEQHETKAASLLAQLKVANAQMESLSSRGGRGGNRGGYGGFRGRGRGEKK